MADSSECGVRRPTGVDARHSPEPSTADLTTTRTQVKPSKPDTLVEEFIAPDRLRATLPPTHLGSTEFPSQKVIAIGRSSWYQDTLAASPMDQLFVPCPTKRPQTPEGYIVMLYAERAKDIRRVEPRVFRFRLDDDTAQGLGIKGGTGEARVSDRDLVERVTLRTDAKEFEWRMTYGDIQPIEPPRPELIRAGTDCKFTPVTYVTPSTALR